MTPAATEWSLGLYAYGRTMPEPPVFLDFYTRAAACLNRVGAPPTHLAVEGKGFSGKFVKFGGPVTRRMLASRCEGMSILTLATTPVGSDAPAFDRVTCLSISFTQPEELLVNVTLNETIVPFGSAVCDEIVRDFIGLTSWSCGYGFCDTVERQPDCHLMCIDNGKLTAKEEIALNAWYNADPATRRSKLRSIYAINILNRHQLDLPVSPHGTLAAMIRSDPGYGVEKAGDLTIWKVPPSMQRSTKARLKAARALIADD